MSFSKTCSLPTRSAGLLRLIALGNCVAERLANLLEALGRIESPASWEVVQVPPVFNVPREKLDAIAAKALECDIVFSQPLFHFGPCNTSALKEQLGDRLHTFSAPNFEAYFPDVMDIRPLVAPEQFPPPLEWHSRIIAQCKAGSVPVEEVPDIYVMHSLFKQASMKEAIRRALAIYERREQGVEIGTLSVVREYFAKEPLFHTWNHPGDRIFRRILNGMLHVLGWEEQKTAAALARIKWQDSTEGWSDWGFGFNAWPIITRSHNCFSFPGREWCRISGLRIDLLTFAIAWYNYYDAHPRILAQALEHAASGE